MLDPPQCPAVIPGRRAEARLILDHTLGGQDPVAYKIKTTSPKRYQVGPSTGVLLPGSAASVRREFFELLSNI